MKLNLLPTYVSKEKSAKAAWFLAVVIAGASIAGAVFLSSTSKAELDKAKDEAQQYVATAQEAVRISREADTIIAQARQIIVNIDLANAMMKHSAVYPNLYDDIRNYVPTFFRVTSMSATPVGPTQCTISMTGVVHTNQEYADLMLALLRIPGAAAVSRDGYQITDKFVPSLNEEDQTGMPIGPGESNIPDDPMRRLDYFMSQASPQGFQGVGNFGTDELVRGAMPNWSQVTVSVVLNDRSIQAPDHRATLTAARTGVPAPGTQAGGPGPNTGRP